MGRFYSCNCPDYSQRHPGKIYTRGISSQESREWNNIKVREVPCKHIIAVRMRLGDYLDIPRDVPLPPELSKAQRPNGDWSVRDSSGRTAQQ